MNGYFSLDSPISYNTPQLFSSTAPSSHLVAPYWANNDISNRLGSVSYEVHHSETSSTYIGQVSSFISQQQQVQFNGTWMILAEWQSVPQFGGSLTAVSKRSWKHASNAVR